MIVCCSDYAVVWVILPRKIVSCFVIFSFFLRGKYASNFAESYLFLFFGGKNRYD